jgi:pimeloyl-ACP methyl ester carboxylesterase
MPVPGFLVVPFAVLGAAVFGGFNLLKTDAAQALRKANVPVLIIHGEADSFVPCEMSDLKSQNPDRIIRCTFPGADHGISYLVDTPRYQKIVTEFLENIL